MKKIICILIVAVLAMVSTPVSAQVAKKLGEGFKSASKGAKTRTGHVKKGFENRIKDMTILGAAASFQPQRDDNNNNKGLSLPPLPPGGFMGPTVGLIIPPIPPITPMETLESKRVRNSVKCNLKLNALDFIINKSLTENGCDSCMVLINDLETGAPIYHYGWSPYAPSYPAVMRAVVYLAALEHGAKPSDVMDTKDGQYVCINADTVRDSNWRRGGYGEMSLDVAFARNSDVAMAMAIDKYLPNKYETLDSLLNMMGFTERGTIKNYRDMKELKLHPIEMLYWINSVVKDEQPNISAINMHYLREAMCLHVEEGMGKGAKGAEMPIAGMTFVTHNDDMPSPANDRSAIFIGFFPAGNPCYSIYADVHRKNFITSKIPAEICKDIVNAMSVFWNYEDFSIQNMMRRIQKEQYNEIPMTLTIPKNLQKEKAINEE